MDVDFEYRGIRFRWDAAKAESNLHKHGVSFDQAVQAFFDPFLQIMDASRNEEARDALLGYDELGRLLFVVHIQFEESIAAEHTVYRLISARSATREERNRYDTNF